MLNIISKSIVSKHNRGPRKVVLNLIKGLEEIGYPYVVNHALDATNQLWIHDDPEAFIASMKLPPEVALLAGPNIFTLPTEVPDGSKNKDVVFIHPAAWVQNFWNKFSTTHQKSVVWATGIDTNKFKPTEVPKDIILVYNKQRSPSEVEEVSNALKKLQQAFEVITYGSYTEEQYKKLLERSKAIIWVGRSESQGIALQEALSMDVPALVIDVAYFGQWEGEGKDRFTKEQLAFTPVTAVPYFNECCGLINRDFDSLETDLNKFFSSLKEYRPRNFILNHLSLAKQAHDFLGIYKEQYQVSESDLKNKTLYNQKTWKNTSSLFKIKTYIKDALRRLIR